MPPPLTPEIAAAIRATWPKTMQAAYADTPGHFTHCACQHGTTPPCEKGRHDRCGRALPLHRPEAAICRKNFTVTHLAEFYRHPSDVNAVGPHRTNAAQVWLADRVCRWICPCAYHNTSAVPPPSAHAPVPPSLLPRRRSAPTPTPTGQLDLLALVTVPADTEGTDR